MAVPPPASSRTIERLIRAKILLLIDGTDRVSGLLTQHRYGSSSPRCKGSLHLAGPVLHIGSTQAFTGAKRAMEAGSETDLLLGSVLYNLLTGEPPSKPGSHLNRDPIWTGTQSKPGPDLNLDPT
ncbi:hypothetical protein CRENBAI_012280 [Crenichthys baileyi]|uniref:Uncharacterized protein n=1 Tax=Crenichthys baileyi TaxID=28760 RepID=A0AAV9S7S6_9TELE